MKPAHFRNVPHNRTAGKNSVFQDMSMDEIRGMMGTFVAEHPPLDAANDQDYNDVIPQLPAEFDARKKWGACVHPIRYIRLYSITRVWLKYLAARGRHLGAPRVCVCVCIRGCKHDALPSHHHTHTHTRTLTHSLTQTRARICS